MPGRLGDDPLSRKRSPSAKGASSARPGLPAKQTSHNDVFFRRRFEGPQSKPEETPDRQLPGPGDATDVDERPEITEVSDIVRTAQVAKSTQGAEQLAGPAPVDALVLPQAEGLDEVIEQKPPAISEPVTPEPPTPITPEAAAPEASQHEAQPQKREGFIKRLFGRFGK
jgi:hypothetical protein